MTTHPIASMRLIDPPPSVVVWFVWEGKSDEDRRWGRFCSVFASEEMARDYAESLARLSRGDLVYTITDEWVMGT